MKTIIKWNQRPIQTTNANTDTTAAHTATMDQQLSPTSRAELEEHPKPLLWVNQEEEKGNWEFILNHRNTKIYIPPRAYLIKYETLQKTYQLSPADSSSVRKILEVHHNNQSYQEPLKNLFSNIQLLESWDSNRLYIFITNISSQSARKTIVEEIHNILTRNYKIKQTIIFQPTMETTYHYTTVYIEDYIKVLLSDKKSNQDKLLLENSKISTRDLYLILNHWKPDNEIHILDLTSTDSNPDWEDPTNNPTRQQKTTQQKETISLIPSPSPPAPTAPPNKPKKKKTTNSPKEDEETLYTFIIHHKNIKQPTKRKGKYIS